MFTSYPRPILEDCHILSLIHICGDHLVLVDEAHNLVDRAREMFSAELGLPQLSALRKALPRGQVSQPISDLRDALKALQRVLGELQQELTQAGRQAQLLEGAPHGVVEAAEDLMSAAQPLLCLLYTSRCV